MKRSVRWDMNDWFSNALFSAIVALNSAACVASAASAESGLGSDEPSIDVSMNIGGTPVTPVISAASVSTMAKGLQKHAPSCEDFTSVMQQECVWFACQGETCLALQMCWRMRDDGFATCSFWDYPDPNMCCPDTAGQVVSSQ